MIVRKETFINEMKMLALFFGASVLQVYFMCFGCTTWQAHVKLMGFCFLMWIFLWRGNDFIASFISQRISWIDSPVKRFATGLLSTIVYSSLATVFLMFIFQNFLNFNFGPSFKFTIYIALVFTILISSFLHSREFLLHWRQATLETEKFKREKISATYESLKSRVKPQLLFNSLMALKKLVYEDKENAVKYIKHLSDVYRYILDTRDKELVSHEEEHKFLTSFIFLLKMRFGSAIDIQLNISRKKFFISPSALQMIMESLVDNSDLDQDVPMTILIEHTDETITLQSKLLWKDDSQQNRLTEIIHNISERYKFLSERKVKYTMNQNSLNVQFPAITEKF
jgi:hypothetical protein